mmetsp:Transcript_1993/g.4625  ORF Transcript_1993/g.4625 Transcript_1993/m.4625 type:complete len:330 (+) Transcript_1993:2683-3672(+)
MVYILEDPRPHGESVSPGGQHKVRVLERVSFVHHPLFVCLSLLLLLSFPLPLSLLPLAASARLSLGGRCLCLHGGGVVRRGHCRRSPAPRARRHVGHDTQHAAQLTLILLPICPLLDRVALRQNDHLGVKVAIVELDVIQASQRDVQRVVQRVLRRRRRHVIAHALEGSFVRVVAALVRRASVRQVAHVGVVDALRAMSVIVAQRRHGRREVAQLARTRLPVRGLLRHERVHACDERAGVRLALAYGPHHALLQQLRLRLFTCRRIPRHIQPQHFERLEHRGLCGCLGLFKSRHRAADGGVPRAVQHGKTRAPALDSNHGHGHWGQQRP